MTQPQDHQRRSSANLHAEEQPRGRADSEIYRRLNAVEVWAAEHRGACQERARAREAWERNTDREIETLSANMSVLKENVAKFAGIWSLIGGLGGGVVTALIIRALGV